MVTHVNLEKQIRRHVVAQRHPFFAQSAPGFEAVCRHELHGLLPAIGDEVVARGGIAFTGHLLDLYRANLHLRTAGRLLLRIAEFRATNFEQLALKTGSITWAWYLPWGTLPRCRVTTHHSRLFHSGAVAVRIVDAIDRYWRLQGVAATPVPCQTLFVRMENDRAMLSLDSSGEHLYRRGVKHHRARAPLRETLAAAILLQAGYRPDMPLLDPMCGAGTFSLEAALMAKNMAPGLLREFAFTQWPAFRPRQWNHLKTEAQGACRRLSRPLIMASDIDRTACSDLHDCVDRHGLTDAVHVSCRDFFDLKPGDDCGDLREGLVVLNPPYGLRLKAGRQVSALFRGIGLKLRTDFKGWNAAVLVPRPDLARHLPSQFTRTPFTHGGLAMLLMSGRIE